MTASTIPLLVLIAFLWWRTKGGLLPIVLFTSIFDAASALNVGAPISPWILALAICLPIKIVTRTLHWRPIPGLNRGAYYALMLFCAYGFFSAMAFPFVFHGILVSNAHNGLNQHLSWSFSNFAQPCYLLSALTVYLVALHSTREELRQAVTWYVYSCICIASFSMYQLANALFHIPYPSAILYTNTFHVVYGAYKIGGLWRLNSTLPEASSAAFYLGAGLGLLGWQMATHKITLKSAASFLLILTALILTVSTLGYACLGTCIMGGLFAYLRFTFKRGGIAPVKVLLFLGLLAALVPALFLTDLGHTISKVFANVFLDKVGSDSYRERSLWNTLAMQSSHDSYYFGAGWGSVRASSFACSLMGNVGIPGVALFLLFLVLAFRPVLTPRRYVRLELFERSLFALTIMMVGLIVAGSDPIMPMIWVLFAVATASKPRRLRATTPARIVEPLPLGKPTLVHQ